MKNLLAFLFCITTYSLFAQNFESLQLWSGDHHNEHSLFGVNACHIKNQDDHAPLGLKSYHNHPAKNFMFSYKAMQMNMGEVMNEDQIISLGKAFENHNYMVVPSEMNSQMHMLGMMYSFTDRFGMSVMGHWLSKEMEMNTRMGMKFQTKSQGLGDVKINGLYELYRKKQKQIFIGGTLSIPTGSIDRRGDTPMMKNVKLPYAMQLGSGTFDGEANLVFLGKKRSWNYGFQQKAGVSFGKNKWNYRQGKVLETNSWLVYLHNDRWSVSSRLSWKRMDNIIGNDPQLNPMMVMTADTRNTGGEILKGHIGFNFFPILNQKAKGLRVAVEYNFPIYQKWNLLHLGIQSGFQVGVGYVF